MLARLLRRVFKVGEIPAGVRAALQAEGIDILEEGIWGSITYRNYRAPGRWSAWRREGFLGALALTGQRIIAYGWSERLMNIPYIHPTLAGVDFALERENRLRATFEASLFHQDRSGTVELRFSTPQAARMLDLLQQRRARETPGESDATMAV